MAQVSDLLDIKGTAIYSVGPDDPVLDAIKVMAEHHVGALLVMKGTELVGIVSERDYARKVILLGRASNTTAVSQIMSAPVHTVSPNRSVEECMRLMTEQRVRHLPVVENGRVIGVISIGDLVKAVIEDQRHTIEQLEDYIHR
jgi:CBS domain-containing protein